VRTPTIATLILSLLTVPALAQQTPNTSGKPLPNTFVVGDPDRRFDSESAKGVWLAVHLLPTIGSPESRAIIQEYTDKAPTVAGVRHIFVSAEPAESFRTALVAVPGGDKQAVYRDAEGHLAARLSIMSPVAAPVLVVLDPTRHELFRHTGKTLSDCLPFSAFAKRIADATQDKEAHEANVASHLAIEGYDPVAYLDDQKAVPGDKKFESAFKGITYRFASAASRDTFNAEPAKYLPAYGGWCATAMAKGDKVEVDPKNFKITNGRLFLFYKGIFGNALNDWKKDEPGLTVKADANWKKVVTEK
jgi:YHS domain-containing protein